MTTVRRAGTASVTVLSGCILLFVFAPISAPTWVRQAGVDIWELYRYQDSLKVSGDETARLDDEATQLHAAIEATEHLVDRMIAETLSLADAAELVEPLVRDRPGFSSAIDWHYAAPSFRLSVARYLIGKVKFILEDDPSRRVITLARLEAEYARMK